MNTTDALGALDIDHVSASQIGQYRRCPRQWAYRHVLKLKMPPDAGVVTGLAFHEAAAYGMTGKMDTGENPRVDTMTEAAADFVSELVDGGEVVMRENDSKNALTDKAVRLTQAWTEEVAPDIEPTAVEDEFTTDVDGIKVVGRMDVVTERRVLDWKTSGRSPARADVVASLQTELYSLATGLPLTFIYLVDLKHGVKVVDVEVGEAETKHAMGIARRTVTEAAQGMALGVWPRNRAGWHCSKKWCGYYDRCMSGLDDATFDERAVEARAVAVR